MKSHTTRNTNCLKMAHVEVGVTFSFTQQGLHLLWQAAYYELDIDMSCFVSPLEKVYAHINQEAER